MTKTVIKNLVRGLCPPLIWNALQTLRQPASRQFGYHNVYERYADAPNQNPWSSKEYLDRFCRTELARVVERLAPAAPDASGYGILTTLINMNPSPLRVHDIGGGTGLRYWALRESFRTKVEWNVSDEPSNAELGRSIMGDDQNLTFDPSRQDCDLALIYAALHYFPDPYKSLRQIADRKPRYIAIFRLTAYRGKPYVTTQNIFERLVPFHIFNIDELVSVMDQSGYDPILCYPGGIDHSLGFHDSIPRELHITNGWHSIFRRRD